MRTPWVEMSAVQHALSSANLTAISAANPLGTACVGGLSGGLSKLPSSAEIEKSL
jgi:hypothetical protein